MLSRNCRNSQWTLSSICFLYVHSSRGRRSVCSAMHPAMKRHIQPAARKMGLPFVNWRCLRTSHATWLVQAGADPKSVQGQMRHSRVSTTMDIYAQIVPTAQRRALEQLAEFAKDATPDARSNSRSITVQ